MKKHNKTLLAVASTVVLLSGCGGGGGDSGSSSSAPETKTTLTPVIRDLAPLVLPEAGLYDAGLLTRDARYQAPIAIDGLRGLALIYPKNETEQRWTVSVQGQYNTQWVGQAGQKASLNGIYPVAVTRTSDRAGDIAPPVDRRRSIFLPKVLTHKGPRSAFDFSETSKFADGTALYPAWMGTIALSNISSATGELVTGAWQQKDAANNDFAFVNTTNNGGALTVEIALSAANCTLEGKGVASKGLSKLDVTGFDNVQCDFKQSPALSPIENRWMAALAKVVKEKSATAYVVTYTSAANKEQLVIGFPELDGLLITADKQ